MPDGRFSDDSEFDLCIVDERALEKHLDALQALKARSQPEFLPFLLVSTTASQRDTRDRVWDLVDEIVSVPTKKAVLHNRLTNLLERRELSTRLSDELDQQRDLFRKIFEASNDAIVIIEPDGKTIRECNPQACELLGYTQDELHSTTPIEIHDGERSAFRAFHTTVLRNGHGWTDALCCRTKGGECLDVEISAATVDVDGRPHMLASIRDVTTRTEQRRVLDNLHDVTTELMAAPTPRAIADVAVIAVTRVFGYDISGVRLLDEGTEPETLELVAATDEAYELLGSEPVAYEVGESVVGSAYDRGERVVIDDIRCEDTPLEYDPIRSVMYLPLGDHGVLSIGVTEPDAFTAADLEHVGILATNVAAALTRAQREQTLNERKEYLSGLFENTTDCIVDVTFDEKTPRIRDANPAFERVFGYDAAEVRGESLPELVVPPDERSQSLSFIRRALAGESSEIEGRRDTETGRREFLIRVVPIQRNGSNLGAYVVYTDVTEQKRRDQQLQVLNRVLRHNLRNKLNIVQGVVERARSTEQGVSDGLVRTGARAIDDLLDLSETARELSKDARAHDAHEPVSVTGVAERVGRSVREEYPRAEVDVTVETEAFVAGTVQLKRALRELCENAVTHSDRREPSVRIVVETDPANAGWITVTVEDDGPGVPEEQRMVLQQGEETQLEHGNGLGLWAVHWIVTSAGGELMLSDRDGRGASVSLNLPTVEPDEFVGDEAVVATDD
ncbi:PAS domain S-box protein [Halorubrum sp. DTA98]|uniref:PAS domain S-box protein n=1 Tax=Halorubrum sp. DTA98 TaxID=3402163 RepID=UPI003AAB6B77